MYQGDRSWFGELHCSCILGVHPVLFGTMHMMVGDGMWPFVYGSYRSRYLWYLDQELFPMLRGGPQKPKLHLEMVHDYQLYMNTWCTGENS